MMRAMKTSRVGCHIGSVSLISVGSLLSAISVVLETAGGITVRVGAETCAIATETPD